MAAANSNQAVALGSIAESNNDTSLDSKGTRSLPFLGGFGGAVAVAVLVRRPVGFHLDTGQTVGKTWTACKGKVGQANCSSKEFSIHAVHPRNEIGTFSTQ